MTDAKVRGNTSKRIWAFRVIKKIGKHVKLGTGQAVIAQGTGKAGFQLVMDLLK